jgi:hypothetical protein
VYSWVKTRSAWDIFGSLVKVLTICSGASPCHTGTTPQSSQGAITSRRALGRLTSLRRLDVGGDSVTDEGLGHLAELVSLESLNLQGAQVTDAGLRHLEGLTSLQTLNPMPDPQQEVRMAAKAASPIIHVAPSRARLKSGQEVQYAVSIRRSQSGSEV